MQTPAEPRYRAPALEKGLDILELMSRSARPLTMSQVSTELGRSKGEIFRMLQVLEERGYIARRAGEDGYALTNRLFLLGIERPAMRGLLEVSLPAMHRLADATGQSCHLVVRAKDEIVVVARVESPGAIGFSVRLGHRGGLFTTGSGTVLRAWSADTPDASLAAIRDAGVAISPSTVVRGVTDVSAPVLESGVAIAALTIPFVEYDGAPLDLNEIARRLIETANEISIAIRVGRSGANGPTAIEQLIAECQHRQ